MAVLRAISYGSTFTNPKKMNAPISTYTIHGYAQVVKGFHCLSERAEEPAERPPRGVKGEGAPPEVERETVEAFKCEMRATVM
jgi:hypothetical protein